MRSTRSRVAAVASVTLVAVGAPAVAAEPQPTTAEAAYAAYLETDLEPTTGLPLEMFNILDPGDSSAGETLLPVSSFETNSAFASLLEANGFDRNFRIWAPVTRVRADQFNNSAWSSCDVAHPVGTVCPADQVVWPYSPSLLGGPFTAKVATNAAYAALLCGNFTPSGGAGPIPRISGTKYEDLDGDGARDAGEPGVAGVTITLWLAGQQVSSTTTASDGSYSFALNANTNPAITAGTYTVREQVPNGWVQSDAPGTVSIGYAQGGSIEQSSAGARSVARTFGGNDFGNYRPVSISGVKVEDMNANGAIDDDDPGLPDWQITATGPDGAHEATTNADGEYTIGGLRPGTYTISETQQDGWNQSLPADPGTYSVTLTSGAEATDQDFANWRPATISGRKFDDHGVDGQGLGDPGIAGWTISLSDASQVTTDSDGRYTFDGLTPGTFTISEELRDGWRQSAPTSGTITSTLRSGQVLTEADFGNVCLGAAAVTVTDQATGEPVTGLETRIEEVEVPGILDNEPSLPRTTTADQITGLLPGTYRVVVFLDEDVYSSDPDTRVVDGRWATVKTVVVPECGDGEVAIDVFRSSRGKVTGGMKELIPPMFATAGYVFAANDDGGVDGSLQFNDHDLDFSLHSRDLRGLWVNDAQTDAWVWGVARYDGSDVRFRLHLVDLGEPGTLDRFELELADAYSSGLTAPQIGGNVQIHKS